MTKAPFALFAQQTTHLSFSRINQDYLQPIKLNNSKDKKDNKIVKHDSRTHVYINNQLISTPFINLSLVVWKEKGIKNKKKKRKILNQKPLRKPLFCKIIFTDQAITAILTSFLLPLTLSTVSKRKDFRILCVVFGAFKVVADVVFVQDLL